MEFEYTDEQKSIRDMAHKFAEKEIAPGAEERDQTGDFPYELFRKIAGLGVLGIEAVIKALSMDQIKILIYDRNFIHKGYICPTCMYMTIISREKCPYCEGELIAYNDIVDEIIESALDKGCEIVDISGSKRLTEAGSIGAVLRYRLKE